MEKFKSKFAQEKARSLYWERWAYIRALKEIEWLTLGRAKRLPPDKATLLRDKYSVEWRVIWKELNPTLKTPLKKIKKGLRS